MSKPKRERTLPDNEAKAIARMLRVSPQKLNLVAQLIRGRKASAALADLQFSRKRIAVDVKKCLESAIANAPASQSVAGTESVSGNGSPCNTNNAPLRKDPRGHHTMQGMARSMQDMGPDPTDRAHHSMDGLF